MVVGAPAAAPVALAHDGGEGYYGQTNDKVVTIAGFALILFFPRSSSSRACSRDTSRAQGRALDAAKARAKSPEWNRGW